MQDQNNVIPLRAALTLSEQAQVERLLWTQDQGRKWKARLVTSSDSQFLAGVSDQLGERQRPADKPGIVRILARLANNYGGERTAESWEMLFDDYSEDLAGISESHLKQIASEHRKASKWFPRVAEIVSRWNEIRYLETEQLRRANVLLGRIPAKPWEIAQ
jgi:hypothetical protein